tara:strand:- start:640 stop:1311 length:672 start_codon:yes stop_codon:yes gene_type:complete
MDKLLLALFTLGLAIPSQGAEKDGIQRDYVKRAILTKEQEKTVIQLAGKCGIKKVDRISTYNLYPTAARGIRVQGAEQVKGREVSYQVLDVSYKKWWHPNGAPRKGDLKIDDYWAGKPRTKKETILKVGQKQYRTGTVQGLSMEEAESILSLFLAKKYVRGPAVNVQNLKQIAWTKPMGFRKRGETISVSFPHKAGSGAGFFDLQITLDDNQLLINQMFQAIP